MTNSEWLPQLRAAVLGEAFWLSPWDGPRAIPVTPLAFRGHPALAFPYAQATVAREIAAASTCAITLSDRRMASRAWRPRALHGRPRLIEDKDGTLFCEQLLTQELLKFPPSRAIADSLLLRREHWWYLPRLMVVVDNVRALPIAERTGGNFDGVLGVRTESGDLALCSVARSAEEQLTAINGTLPTGGDAVLLQHDVSVPDLERWPRALTRGRVREGAFLPDQPLPDVTLPAPLGLLARLLRHRHLAKRCRRELAAAET